MTKLLGTRDLAALLGVSLRKLEQMIERGELPAYVRLGRTRKWRDDVVEQWIDQIFARTTGDATKSPHESRYGGSIIEEGGVMKKAT